MAPSPVRRAPPARKEPTARPTNRSAAAKTPTPAKDQEADARAPAPTSLKLNAGTRQRVALAARDAGMSMHAFMVDALEKAAARAGTRRDFVAEALAAKERFLRTGKVVRQEDLEAFYAAKAAGKNPPRPKAVQWRK